MSQDKKALLGELQKRHQEAHRLLNEATQAFQAAQQAHVTATTNFQKAQQALALAQQQFHGWNTAVSTVAAEIAAQQEAVRTVQPELPIPCAQTLSPAPIHAPDPIEALEAPNKTDMIRELLSHHPQGMAPTEIWDHVRGQFKHRAYLYSVLKRLTDRDELCVRRGKYAIRTQEVKPELEITIQ